MPLPKHCAASDPFVCLPSHTLNHKLVATARLVLRQFTKNCSSAVHYLPPSAVPECMLPHRLTRCCAVHKWIPSHLHPNCLTSTPTVTWHHSQALQAMRSCCPSLVFRASAHAAAMTANITPHSPTPSCTGVNAIQDLSLHLTEAHTQPTHSTPCC